MSSRFPMTSFPKGWFTVAWSGDLKPGDVKPVRYFDEELVLFRSESGEPRLLNAHCPHLGAHLGHGGVVKGERLECPFHAWQYDGGGKCVHVPYAEKIPPRAKVKSWPLVEKNGVIMTWHDPDGSEEAGWEMPDVPFLNDEAWFKEEAHAEWQIKSHTQELVENAIDQSHFRCVHSLESAEILKMDADGHHLNMHGSFVLEAGAAPAQLEWNWHGLSFGYVHTRNSGIENCQLLMYTPIDEETVQVRFTTVVKRVKNDELSRKILHGTNDETIRLFNQDIDIWEAKIYRERPELAKGDGDFMKYRRWAKQFYGQQAAAE